MKSTYKNKLSFNNKLYRLIWNIVNFSIFRILITNQLNSIVKIHGNQSKEVIKRALNKAHFSILPSKSEGWPKAIAEGMFFGVIPIATKVSCVPKMLDDGKRGILIVPEVNAAVLKIEETLKHKDLKRMSKLASDWSQTFTLEYFESEIKKLLIH